MEPATRARPLADLFPLKIFVCGWCRASAATGGVRTLCAEGESLSVTWHDRARPHHVADLILAEDS
ncbi:hypothetical protein ACWDYJ_23870 [Streptomyces sp. NPDC003042]